MPSSGLPAVGAVGIAGGPRKVAYLRELDFDEAIDHRAGDFKDQPAGAAPDGIDVYFENVSGHVLNAVFPRLNPSPASRCAGSSCWITSRDCRPAGPHPALLWAILVKSLTIRAFIQTEFAADLMGKFLERATPGVRGGSLRHKEDVVDGLENAPEAFRGTLDGKNFGKLLVRVN
jgi:NADPH-dependent curcumin reductase CurA